MLQPLLLFLIAFVPCHMSLAGAPFTYRDVHQQISAFDTDPVELLDVITAHINERRIVLSFDERDALIKQLQRLKQRLCWRPGGGLLALPVLATIVTGCYTLSTYMQFRTIQDAPEWAKMIFFCEEQACYDFINSFLHFIVIATATFLVEAEYCDRVGWLFAKERALECKIDKLITLLQQ